MFKVFLLFILATAIFTLAACSGLTNTTSVEATIANIEDAREDNFTEHPKNTSTEGDNPHAVILNAYIELEQSDFILYNEELIGHSIFSQVGGIPFGSNVK